MTTGSRLTGCAASDHPEPAAAVGEVVGYLQNSLAGSPEFALLLVDESIGSVLSTIAGAVHSLLGPDLLLATTAPSIAGADSLTARRGSVVVWAVCGVDIEAFAHTDVPVESMRTVSIRRHPDESVTAAMRPSLDAPRPLSIGGDGRRRRLDQVLIRFPPGSATVVRAQGRRDLGPAMTITEARGRRLQRLDHVPVRAVLLDRLETTDAFVDGPSIEFPPLRAVVSPPVDQRAGQRTLDVLVVDPEEGYVEVDGAVYVGEQVQLIAYDRAAATAALAGRILGAQHVRDVAGLDRAVLIDGDVSPIGEDAMDRIATVAIGHESARSAGRAADGDPWQEMSAIVVDVAEET